MGKPAQFWRRTANQGRPGASAGTWHGKIQSDLIDQYQATSRQAALNQVYGLLVESRALTVAKGDPRPDGDDGSDDEDKDPKEEDPEELKIDLEKQREELKISPLIFRTFQTI